MLIKPIKHYQTCRQLLYLFQELASNFVNKVHVHIFVDFLKSYFPLFFRVVVQNERYDDWTPTLITLKKLFSEYHQRVVHYHERPGVRVPTGWNSTAAQGNFLEVLNMALNGE